MEDERGCDEEEGNHWHHIIKKFMLAQKKEIERPTSLNLSIHLQGTCHYHHGDLCFMSHASVMQAPL